LAEVNQEHIVYLVEVDDEDELAEWLGRHHEELFEEELNAGTTTRRLLAPGALAQYAARVVFVRTPPSTGHVRLRSKTDRRNE
jgi:hypothetical protein